MAVTVASYNLSAGWTGVTFLDLLEEAFVDAGIVATAAYDRFADGSYAHMVVEVVYDAAKTYGKRYYRFMAYNDRLWLNVSNGWNAATNVPAGTQYLDYGSTTASNTTSGWWEFAQFSSATSLVLTRYQSSIDTDFNVFKVQTGTYDASFFLVPASANLQPYIDLDVTSFGCPHWPHCYVNTSNGYWGGVSFPSNLGLRRDVHTGAALRNNTGFLHFPSSHYNYAFWGKYENYGDNYASGDPSLPFTSTGYYGFNAVNNGWIPLPVDDPANNPAQPALKYPIYAGLPYNAYLQDPMPADFGAAGSLSNALTPGDKLIVTAGTEEWEVIARRNNSYTGGITPAFVARTA